MIVFFLLRGGVRGKGRCPPAALPWEVAACEGAEACDCNDGAYDKGMLAFECECNEAFVDVITVEVVEFPRRRRGAG